jgi:hypothetical protein
MAAADGSEVMMTSAAEPTAAADATAVPPKSLNASIARGAMSWPITEKPAATRFLLIADPMMPRPIIPTVLSIWRVTKAVAPLMIYFV